MQKKSSSLTKKKNNNNNNNNLSTRIIQSFPTEKALNRGPYQDTTNTISRRDGRNESQTTNFNSLQYIVCSFAKCPSCRVTVRLNGMLYSRILFLLSDRLTVKNSFIWIAVLRKQVDVLTVYLSCMRHLHTNYFFPTFVILAAFVCHYFQSTRSTKGRMNYLTMLSKWDTPATIWKLFKAPTARVLRQETWLKIRARKHRCLCFKHYRTTVVDQIWTIIADINNWFSHDVFKIQREETIDPYQILLELKKLKTKYIYKFSYWTLFAWIDSLELFKLLLNAACTWRLGELSCRLKKAHFGGFCYLNSHCKRKSIPFLLMLIRSSRDKFMLS